MIGLSLEQKQTERQILALERIATALEKLATPETPAEPEAEPVCQHPLDRRADFGVTNGEPDWQCLDCGYRSIAPEPALKEA